MPPEIGCVYWRTSAEPCTSVLIPWYLGITKVPESYHKPVQIDEHLSLDFHLKPPEGTFDYDSQHTWWTFRKLQNLVNKDYQNTIKKIRAVWDEFEERLFSDQTVVEDVAMRIFSKDRILARNYLTEYAEKISLKATDMARMLEEPASKIDFGCL